MKREIEKAGRTPIPTGPEVTNQRQDISIKPGERRNLRLIESEADTLERGAAILAKSVHGHGPESEQLGRALELLLRAEAERKRLKLRNGRSLAALFPDEVAA